MLLCKHTVQDLRRPLTLDDLQLQLDYSDLQRGIGKVDLFPHAVGRG